MNYFGIVSLFNGLFALFVGLYVLFRNPRSALYRSFAVFSISAALWAIFYAIWQFQEAKPMAFLFMRLLMIPCYYAPFTFFWFVLILVDEPKRRKFLPFCAGIPSFLVLFSFSELTVKDVVPKLYFPYWPEPGLLMHFYVVLYCVILIYSFFLLFREWSRSSGMRRWQLRWVALTTLCGWTGGSTNMFLWYDIPVPPIPNFFVAVFFLIIAYAIMRRQLFDVDTLADIVQEAKLSAIGTLAAGINHEIRNPLYVVKGMAESFLENKREGILDRLSPEERERKAEEILEKTIDQINRVVDITKRLSEFSRSRTGAAKPERAPLEKIVDNVLSFVGHELEIEKVEVEKKISKDATVLADRKHVEEIFVNLILNACQAMPRGGELKISEERRNGSVFVRVSDSGTGIPTEARKRIFEPFFSTKQEKGTGLGLYIVKKLVERNQGKIRFDTSPRGTTFILEFKG